MAEDGVSTTVREGFVLGESDFFLHQPYSVSAVVLGSQETTVFSLSRAGMEEMEQTKPASAKSFLRIMTRVLARQLTWTNKFSTNNV